MFEQLRHFIYRLLPLSDEEFAFFTSLLELKRLPKKHLYLTEGETCQEVAFVNTGCFRLYTVKAGVEFNNDFVFENGWITDYKSFLTRQPSVVNIQTLEDAEVLTMSYARMQTLYQKSVVFERFGRLISEQIFLNFTERILALLNDSPEQRYLTLVEQQPRLWQRLSQQQLSSYLGITPESLSRIRKRVAQKGE